MVIQRLETFLRGGGPRNRRAQLYAGSWEIEPQYFQRHVSPGCIPGWRERSEKKESAILAYGQRFAVSSHPAARTGWGAGIGGAAGTGIRAVG